MVRFSVSLVSFLCCALSVVAQDKNDNVHIVSCVDQYVFKNGDDGKPVIVNTTDYVYGVTKFGANVQPNVFYGEFIRLDKASSRGTAQYKSATPSNIFFDDTKVCFFNSYIPKVGKTLKASFERTYLDPIYFTKIALREDNYVENKKIQVVIPQSFSQFHLKDWHLPSQVEKTCSVNASGDSVFTYVIHELPAIKHEESAPSWSSYSPYILVIGAFKNAQDMYAWSKKLADVDCNIPNLNDILAEIRKGAKDDRERIANTYAWVQRNIRYLAYEAGISAHQPATPAETIRKRYGDCKAKSLLLKTLLCAQGFDARLTDIGTEDIPYFPQQVPTIAAIDHAICTVFYQGQAYFLDATNSYIPMGYIPGNIQGREALVENGNGCEVLTLPVLPEDACLSTEVFDCSLVPQDNDAFAMKGKVNSSWRGDWKAMVLSTFETIAQDDKDRCVSRILGFTSNTDRLSNVVITGNQPQDEILQIVGAFCKNDVGLSADGNVYVDMNPDSDVLLERVDTAKRKCDFMLEFKAKVVRTVKMTIPKGMRLVSMPSPYESHSDWCDLRRVFRSQGNQIVMEKEWRTKKRRIPLKGLPAWNKLMTEWTEACNEQVVLAK